MVDLTSSVLWRLFHPMRTSHQFNKQVTRWISGSLAVLLLLLTLATNSPALHEWLHADQNTCEHHCHGHHDEAPDSDQKGHVCAVTLLDTGTTAPITIGLPKPTNLIVSPLSLEAASLWHDQAPIEVSARGPPTVSVV